MIAHTPNTQYGVAAYAATLSACTRLEQQAPGAHQPNRQLTGRPCLRGGRSAGWLRRRSGPGRRRAAGRLRWRTHGLGPVELAPQDTQSDPRRHDGTLPVARAAVRATWRRAVV